MRTGRTRSVVSLTPYGRLTICSRGTEEGQQRDAHPLAARGAPRHGYEIGKLIEARSGGRLTFALPTLYPTLLCLENRGSIKGRWVEKPGERRRCFYRLTQEGRRKLIEQRETWEAFIDTVNR